MTMENIQKNATTVANENLNVANEATSINNSTSNTMVEENVIATEVAKKNVANATNESVNAAEDAASINERPQQKEEGSEMVERPTKVAIIDGEERKITVAHTEYSMELPKDKVHLIDSIDRSKMLKCIFHLAKPKIFWDANLQLFDDNNQPIEKGTENVFVSCPTSGTYWRFATDEILENVEVHNFASVQDYAQAIGCTNLYSRGLNNTEKMGVAAMATGDEACKTVFEFSKKHKMSTSTAQHYLDYSIKATTLLELTMGNIIENIPVLGRTVDEAEALLDVVKGKFAKIAEKRYIIRPINALLHMEGKGYSIEIMKLAIESLTEKETKEIKYAQNGIREAIVSSTLTSCLDKLKTQQEKRNAA